jgi:hypothetical protein
LSNGCWSHGAYEGLFYFGDGDYSSNSGSLVVTIKEMFCKLRLYNEVSEYIEDEYEKIFLMYKLIDFNKL